MSWKKTVQSLILSVVVAVGLPAVAGACATGQQSCTSNYAIGESFFGSGGNLNACSGSYCAKQSAGETAVGNTKSTNYQAQAGFNTDRSPYIEMYVDTTSMYLGYLSTSATKTATATFHVKTYLASGYVVQTVGSAPTYNGYTMAAPSTPAASATGTEQFGINLVQNRTSCTPAAPANFGADPVPVPSSSFSVPNAGYPVSSLITAGYNTCGKFKYANGDTIAASNQSSGETDYTISYIFNISTATRAGLYTMNQVLVATSTY
jgi:hypothetical protein